MSTQTQSFLQGGVVDGKYELRQYLGGSERGPVFLTEFGNLRRQKAAIKLVHVRPGSAELQLSRWRMAANLLHPHLIRILDMGRCELENAPALYVVTELADENLAQILPERTLTPKETRDALAPLLDVLSYMHSRGFVHARVKPSNIMAVGEELKLSSDSIVHLAESPESFAQPSAYDPPEGMKGGAFPAGDVWSLGMTIVEVLTQKLPAWNAVDRKEPALPLDLPEPFIDIVRHCLRREPKNRWSAPDIAADLPDKTAVAEVAKPAATARASQPAQIRSEQAEVPPAEVAMRKPAGGSAIGASSKIARKYLIGTAAAGLVLLTMFGMSSLLRQNSNSEPGNTSATDQPAPDTEKQPQLQSPRPPDAKPAAAPATVAHATRIPAVVARSAAPVTKQPAASASQPTRIVDLSTPADSTAGAVVHEVKPDVPSSASDTISGTVRVVVKASVDSSGNVTNAEFAAEGPSRYFANLSLRTAREWKFSPPKINGSGVASTWLIHFGYTNTGTNVSSQIMK